MEDWQKDVVQYKLDRARQQMFSLEVDLRVARRISDKDAEQQVVGLITRQEAVLAALEEELNG